MLFLYFCRIACCISQDFYAFFMNNPPNTCFYRIIRLPFMQGDGIVMKKSVMGESNVMRVTFAFTALFGAFFLSAELPLLLHSSLRLLARDCLPLSFFLNLPENSFLFLFGCENHRASKVGRSVVFAVPSFNSSNKYLHQL